MSLDLGDFRYRQSGLETFKAELAAGETPQPLASAPKLEELIGAAFKAWPSVQVAFSRDFRFFDRLLHQIHFKRRASFNLEAKANILKFLTIGYLQSNDVRYFNELLWFYRKDQHLKNYLLLSLEHFHNCLDEENRHSFPLCEREEAVRFVREVSQMTGIQPDNENRRRSRIGLIGTPLFFQEIYRELMKEEYEVEVFFLPYHSNKFKRRILRSGLVFRLLLLAKGIHLPYTTLDLPHKDPRILDILKAHDLDLGFHKLGFIIKSNIIGAFKTGLLNDHLGVLPFIRGRSTLEYSLLFGFPLGATLHFIEEAVDTGELVGIYTYDSAVASCRSCKAVKRAIRSRMSERALSAIRLATQAPGSKVPNDASKGLTYYEMHPDLRKFIDRRILRS